MLSVRQTYAASDLHALNTETQDTLSALIFSQLRFDKMMIRNKSKIIHKRDFGKNTANTGAETKRLFISCCSITDLISKPWTAHQEITMSLPLSRYPRSVNISQRSLQFIDVKHWTSVCVFDYFRYFLPNERKSVDCTQISCRFIRNL